jgi:hypothetical protein
MAIKITISKQMVACDKQKTALVCFWSVKWPKKSTCVIFSLQKHTRAVFLLHQLSARPLGLFIFFSLAKMNLTKN